MAIDPSISLGVRPPVIAPLQIQNPLEQYGKVQSLRNLMQQGQLGQLNVQQTQLENEALQEKRRRASAVADLFTGGTRPTEDQILHVGGPEAAAAIKALHDADKAKFDVLEATTKATNRAALGIKALPPEQRDFGYRAARAQIIGANPAFSDHLPEQYPGDAWLEQQITQGLNTDQFLSNVRADAKAKLEAPGIAADVATKQAESEQKQRQIEASTLAPALARGAVAYQQALATMPPARAALYSGFQTPRDLLMFANTPHEQITAQQAEATAVETARQHAAENAVSQAHLNIARRADARAEQVYQNTYGPGANEALVGVDPKLRVQATTNAQKAADEYSKAVESTGNMQSIIDLARSGNKVAYAYAPTTGVLTINTAQGVKRVNMPEIKSYGGAGSAMDQIEGWLGKQTSGASIPADILKNMEEVNKSISDSAAKNYDTKLGSINQNYHANFKPSVKAATSGATPPPRGGQYKTGDTRVINGKTYTRDADGNWK